MQGTPRWFTILEQEQHEDQAQSILKSRVQVQRDEVQNGSSADQVQSTSAMFKCHFIDKRRDTASRGPTTIAAPESQFRTCPSDHGKASSNIAP
ncbi:hypothetical protein F511_15706 [Dorcoceras hygrometricum]|uniref:Uncharacterized protein n=1 Tax=Dorcoceras hygrometricum TaxID=472368 RepID=A0A2Z7BJZ3_9LAMI|nr:hypothetical protein F511_15706 [Dorcoceras hygrometricum]